MKKILKRFFEGDRSLGEMYFFSFVRLLGASTVSTSSTLIEVVGFQWDKYIWIVENGGIL